MDLDSLTVGTEVASVEFSDISAKDMAIVSAIMDDPNPIHFDPRALESTGQPGLVNQGPINMSYLTQVALRVADSPTGLVSLDVRFEDNVFEGDDVTATATIAGVDEAAGTIDLDLTLEKASGAIPVTGSATVEPDPDCFV